MGTDAEKYKSSAKKKKCLLGGGVDGGRTQTRVPCESYTVLIFYRYII